MKDFATRTAALAAALLPAVAHTAAASDDRPARRPNILVMMTDDHTTQGVSAYGHRLMHTPNLDRIANEGIRLDRAYVANAISGPSRPGRTRVRDVRSDHGGGTGDYGTAG